ncbi:phosphoribosyltransferase [Amnibacterium flavum]|uniref:Phosphoribosyltransferase n=1 Tax=Amnibacterium flavum TaxID=2173173 RepID=A0A2V1HN14_9MICO|nr:phosphoribosyltransferase [Amnibacterium flavum]PVZ93928.1 phosphoribosyltransferase [Amnibacterium flavum]
MATELTAAPAEASTDGAPPKEVLGWLEFGEAARSLAHSVAESGFAPEIVIAIARGGLIVGGAVAYALGVKSCGSINVELYTGIDETLPEPLVLPPFLDGAALDGKRVLLVDDVSQSGQTLALAVDIITGMGAEVRSVTLYTKPQTTFVPDFAWKDTDRWIVFPWSAQPPVTVAP